MRLTAHRFLRGAAPKDVVQVRLLQVRKRFLRAVVLEVEAGPERVEPFCQFYEKCGGCPWQTVPKKQQRHTLNAHVKRRLGGLVSDERLIHPMLTFDVLAWRSTTHECTSEMVALVLCVSSQPCPYRYSTLKLLMPPLGNMLLTLREQLRNGALKGTAKLTADRQGVSGTVALELKACSKKRVKASWTLCSKIRVSTV